MSSQADAIQQSLAAAVFVTENKKGLLKLIDREMPPVIRSSPAFQSVSKWLGKYDAVSAFVKLNRKGLAKLVDHEAAGISAKSVKVTSSKSWLTYFGKKWYTLYLF